MIRQFIIYLIIGFFNTFFGFSIIFLCMYFFKFPPIISNIFGYSLGIIVSYFLNSKFTFKFKNKTKIVFVKFMIVFLISYLVNFIALIFLIHQLDIHEGLAQVISGIIYIILFYLLNKYYVFIYSKDNIEL